MYAAEAAGVAFTRPGEEGGEGAAAGVPEEGSELLEGLGPDLPGTEGAADGAAAEVEQGAAGAELATAAAAGSEAMQLRVQAAYYRKDANEVLMRDGAGMLRAFLENAEPFPIRGLLRCAGASIAEVLVGAAELRDPSPARALLVNTLVDDPVTPPHDCTANITTTAHHQAVPSQQYR